MTDKNYIGNVSTIGKFILISFAGWIISLAASKGLDLGVDAQTLAQILGVILGLAYSYIDAKYPNTFDWLGNGNLVDMGTILGYPSEEVVLNDEYTTNPEGVEDDGC